MIKKKKNNYFTKVHEQAVVDYQNAETQEERNKIYKTILRPAFREMNEKIVYKFKFNNIPNISSLMDDCDNEIASLIYKFKPAKNKKAFSYFSVIIRNWYFRKSKNNQKDLIRNTSRDFLSNTDHEEFFSVENPYEKKAVKEEFFDALKKEMNYWHKTSTNKNDQKLIEGVLLLFENAETMEADNFIFGKKAIKQEYLPTITNLTSREINESLARLKEKYKYFISDWFSN